MMFTAEFFAEHQRVMLGLLNSPIGGSVRRGLWIPETHLPIVRVTPESYHSLLPNGKIRTVIHANKQHAEAMHKNYRHIWERVHAWDMRIANRFMPAFNLGFDTYTYQPDSSIGYSNYMLSVAPTTNYYTSTDLYTGEHNAQSNYFYSSLIKFTQVSEIPSGSDVTSATLNFWVSGNACSVTGRTYAVFRVLRNWVDNESTYNIWSTSNNWTTGGCGSAGNDFDGTAWASLVYGTVPSVGTKKSFALTATEFEKWVDGTYPNYGFLFKIDGSVGNDLILYDSPYSASSAERPELVVVATPPADANLFHLWSL